jgi:hypothetical protein
VQLYFSLNVGVIPGVQLATEPGISLIILPLTRILQRNLKRAYLIVCGARGGVVVKALRYKPAGRGFDSRGVIGIFQ